jgi:hypothetical protein
VVDRIEIKDTSGGVSLDALKGTVGNAVTKEGDHGSLGIGIDGGFEKENQIHGVPFRLLNRLFGC